MNSYKLYFLIIAIFSYSIISSAQDLTGLDESLFPQYSKYLKKLPNELKKEFVFNFITDKKQVVITFDDGPNYNTKKIISFLIKNKIPATFFVITNQLNNNNLKYYNHELIDLGIHSYEHNNFDKISKIEIQDDIQKSLKFHIDNNINTKFFRTPYGVINQDLSNELKKSNLKGVLWSVDSHDWNSKDPEYILTKSTEKIVNGSIILFHDALKLELLKNIVDKIHKKGFKIISLKDALKTN